MKLSIFQIVLKSLIYYRKPVFYQFIIIVLLTAIITGSILTGYSVKQSLKKSAQTKLGNTDLVISSGLRYFSPELGKRFSIKSSTNCVSMLETTGYCLNLGNGSKALNINIYSITRDFFSFQGNNYISLKPGEAAVNTSLAKKLDLHQGDEISISFRQLTDIPASSPFAPSTENSSIVLKATVFLSPAESGNFSLGINQITPDNVFINLEDLKNVIGTEQKINRLLIKAGNELTVKKASEVLQQILLPEDIGLKIRHISKTNEEEIISSRIFIDQVIYEEIKNIIPESEPVITYLANSFSFQNNSTPYSFIAAVGKEETTDVKGRNNIVINNWLAEDLHASENDTITIAWYNPGKMMDLEERSEKFRVLRIVGLNGIYSDSLLMPEFPGIAGKESCTDWDAGVKIRMDRIRKKDEEYWKKFRGTPKAFLSYEKGKELWGNNFGPLTAIRFPSSINADYLKKYLSGKLDPEKCGFSIRNIKEEMILAAKESVDFTSLFISLGFFLILSSIILLLLSVNSALDSRVRQIATLFSLGFRNKWINKVLLLETGLIALTGSLIGAFAGTGMNWLIIKALNSVWIGAVQTDSLDAFSDITSIIYGFIATFIIILIFVFLRLKRFTSSFTSLKTGVHIFASGKLNRWFLSITGFSAIVVIIVFLVTGITSKTLSFTAGILVFFFLILLWRQRIIAGKMFRPESGIPYTISGKYFRYNPSHALAPVIFIAAGLFAVIITGVNRLEINNKSLGKSGGTGGYLIWSETAIPVKADLNLIEGRHEFGFDEKTASEMFFLQGRRTSGDDASCLNLNHISSPPLLGIDVKQLIRKRSFSFSGLIAGGDKDNPWSVLTVSPADNVIYGIADQTVLEWGLKKTIGDTLKIKSESGQLLNVVIAGSLESSVFQGYILINEESIRKYFPSISGNSVFLIEGKSENTQKYIELLKNRFENYGISISTTKERLSSFFRVTNTYLSVFTILGGLGLILGIAGLGFVLKRNYFMRRREFALLMACGFTYQMIRKIVLKEHVYILLSGFATGIISPLIATFPSIRNGSDIPWISLFSICVMVVLIGGGTIFNSVRQLKQTNLIEYLRRE